MQTLSSINIPINNLLDPLTVGSIALYVAIVCQLYSVSPKNPPCGFLKFFPKRLGIFNQFLTHLLYDHFYTRLQFFFSNISNFDKVMPY